MVRRLQQVSDRTPNCPRCGRVMQETTGPLLREEGWWRCPDWCGATEPAEPRRTNPEPTSAPGETLPDGTPTADYMEVITARREARDAVGVTRCPTCCIRKTQTDPPGPCPACTAPDGDLRRSNLGPSPCGDPTCQCPDPCDSMDCECPE
jgi:hypothetical protein